MARASLRSSRAACKDPRMANPARKAFTRARRRVRKVRQERDPTRRRNAVDERHLRVLLAAVLSPDARCVDVGANVGTVLETICALAPHGNHFAFEPLPEL